MSAFEGDDVNACNVGGQKYTKLMAESIDGNVDKVKALLEVPGIDLNIQVERYTALMLAVNWGKTEVVKLLLADERCDALWTDPQFGGNALNESCVFGRYESLELLLAVPGMGDQIMVEKFTKTAMTGCALYGRPDHIKCCNLLFAHPQFDVMAHPYLMDAASSREPECVKLFLSKGVDVNFQDAWEKTALIQAAKGGNKECVQLLLDAGANPNMKGQGGKRALDFAPAFPEVEAILEAVTEVLPDYAGDVDALTQEDVNLEPASILMKAAEDGNLKKVSRLLLADGINVNLANGPKKRKTALMYAIQAGSVEVIEVLLADDRVDVLWVDQSEDKMNITNCALRACAHQHSKYSNKPAFEVILAAEGVHATVNDADDEGNTFTTYLAGKGQRYVEFIKLLLEVPEYNVHYINEVTGASYLMEAVAGAAEDCVKLFIDSGVDVKLKNKDGKSALDLAKEKGGLESIVTLLEPLTSP